MVHIHWDSLFIEQFHIQNYIKTFNTRNNFNFCPIDCIMFNKPGAFTFKFADEYIVFISSTHPQRYNSPDDVKAYECAQPLDIWIISNDDNDDISFGVFISW